MKDLLSIDSFEGLVGASPEMRQIFEDARKIAETRSPILIIGEVGTGKRSLARAIHKVSGDEENQFKILAFYREEKNATPLDFKAGMKLFEKGKAGTLYVEEIATLSLAEQFGLEEFLKSSVPAHKGSNARLIAATSGDLQGMIKDGKFRGGLYFLFFVMKLPPLRERSDDIPPLLELFRKRYSEIHGKKLLDLHPQAIVESLRYPWPGNVAELENSVKRAIIVTEKGRIMPTGLGLQYDGESNEILNFKKAREKFEKGFLEKAIARNKGNITHAAKEIGISRPTIYELMNKYDIPTWPLLWNSHKNDNTGS